MGESRRPHGGPRLSTVAGDGGAALQDEAGVAAVLDGRPHQEFWVGQRPGGVLHVTGVWTVHDWEKKGGKGGLHKQIRPTSIFTAQLPASRHITSHVYADLSGGFLENKEYYTCSL